MRRDERGSWYLLTGLVLGVLLGLFYAWRIRPVSYTNATPASLRADFKDQYRVLIAAAYQANGDLVRAKARLDLLNDADVYRSLAEQAQRLLAEGSSADDARALGLLAVELGKAPATTPSFTQTPGAALTDISSPITPSLELTATLPAASPVNLTASDTPPAATEIPTEPSTEIPVEPSATSTTSTPFQEVEAASPPVPAATRTPLDTWTPTAAPEALYVLDSQDQVCDPDLAGPLIQVQVQDAGGQPAPGVEVVVSWDGGEDRFFTGLKPELGLGYADFSMTPGVAYSLRLAQSGELVSGLATSECESSSGERYWGSWLLTFGQATG